MYSNTAEFTFFGFPTELCLFDCNHVTLSTTSQTCSWQNEGFRFWIRLYALQIDTFLHLEIQTLQIEFPVTHLWWSKALHNHFYCQGWNSWKSKWPLWHDSHHSACCSPLPVEFWKEEWVELMCTFLRSNQWAHFSGYVETGWCHRCFWFTADVGDVVHLSVWLVVVVGKG